MTTGWTSTQTSRDPRQGTICCQNHKQKGWFDSDLRAKVVAISISLSLRLSLFQVHMLFFHFSFFSCLYKNSLSCIDVLTPYWPWPQDWERFNADLSFSPYTGRQVKFKTEQNFEHSKATLNTILLFSHSQRPSPWWTGAPSLSSSPPTFRTGLCWSPILTITSKTGEMTIRFR